MSTATSTAIAGRELSLSKLDKIYWPRDGYTKGELIHYYVEAAPYLLPYLHDRPLVFTRYPDGIDSNFFYQKNAPEYLPEWIPTYLWQSKDKTSNNLILAEETAALAWLANQACLEIHPWLSRQFSILNPDFIAFDLDPYEGCPFAVVVEIALLIKRILDDLGLRSYLKTSGASGLHIFLPIINKYDYSQGRNWAGKLAGLVCQALPHEATIERSVKDRGDRVYVDYMQNVVGKTLCSPYSVRPREGAPVSTPLRWEELPDISPSDFNIKTVFTRLKKLGDLFSPALEDKQNIDEAIGMLL